MALSCSMKVLQFLLFAFNFVFWLCGAAVIGIGIYARIQLTKYEDVIDGGGISSSIILILAGFAVMFIGGLGCCGALRQNKIKLLIFFFCLFAIFAFEIIAGVLAYTQEDKTMKAIKHNIKKIVHKEYYVGNSTSHFAKTIDYIQQKLKCCGVNGYADWKNSTWGKMHVGKKTPVSCCLNEKASNCNVNVTSIYKQGCVGAVKIFINDNLILMGGIGVGVAWIQLLGMIFALCLYRAIGHESI